jgi:hypothetical protein
MNLTSKEIIKNLNERLLMQSVVVETLCDLLVDTGVVTHEDLEDMIKENLESQHTKIQELRNKTTSSIKVNIKSKFDDMFDGDDVELFQGLYFGPVGQA